MMERVNKFVLALSACAAALSLCESLLPEGAVKKTAYFVMSLVAASVLAAPIAAVGEISLDIPEFHESGLAVHDFVMRETQAEFELRMEREIARLLAKDGIEAENISVNTSIGEDGSISINKVRIEAAARYSDRLDYIEELVGRETGAQCDVVCAE